MVKNICTLSFFALLWLFALDLMVIDFKRVVILLIFFLLAALAGLVNAGDGEKHVS